MNRNSKERQAKIMGHPDYHQPSDHTDRLNWEKMIEITKAAFLNAWNLANENKY